MLCGAKLQPFFELAKFFFKKVDFFLQDRDRMSGLMGLYLCREEDLEGSERLFEGFLRAVGGWRGGSGGFVLYWLVRREICVHERRGR